MREFSLFKYQINKMTDRITRSSTFLRQIEIPEHIEEINNNDSRDRDFGRGNRDDQRGGGGGGAGGGGRGADLDSPVQARKYRDSPAPPPRYSY